MTIEELIATQDHANAEVLRSLLKAEDDREARKRREAAEEARWTRLRLDS